MSILIKAKQLPFFTQFHIMPPLSIIIPTYNEAENLRILLPLLHWADEILIVDSFSTDATIDVAKSFGAKVLQRQYDGPAYQKNWAIPQAKNEWILLFDADERPTPELLQEIAAVLGVPNVAFVAYWIHRKNFFMGKEIRFSGWQNDAVIRLFKRDFCRYTETQVHEEIVADGKVDRLKNSMLHYTYRSMSHFLAKIERYAAWSAQDYATKTGKITWFHLYIKPAFRFFKHYLLKQGFRDGKEGLIISKVMAWSVFLRYVMLMEVRRTKAER